MLTPLEVLLLTPLPTVGVNVDAMLWFVELGFALDMPAFAFLVARDFG
jgi:hypothetical protein